MSTMEILNAFVGKTTTPTAEEVAAAPGPAAEVWKQLVDWMAEQEVTVQEWNSYSAKSGWAMRLKVKKRNIVYLAPCDGCFRVALVLGDKAMAAAQQSKLSKSVLKALDEAPHYAEGTGIRLMVHESKDLHPIRILAAVKLAN